MNFKDYPGIKSPSVAQKKQRYKWVVKGALAGMEARLTQLITDSRTPHGKFKAKLLNARMSVKLALKYLEEVDPYVGEEK